MEFKMDITSYIKVVLNANTDIVAIDCDLIDIKYLAKELIGKNWFDTFIARKEQDHLRKVFQDLLDGKEDMSQTFNNDILCKDGRYKYMDFHHQVFEKDGVKYLNLVGVEHFVNQNNTSFKYLGSVGIGHFVSDDNVLLMKAREHAEVPYAG